MDDGEERGVAACEDTPQWRREAVEKARKVLGSEDWLELPSKDDFHEYKVMEAFCLDVEDENLRRPVGCDSGEGGVSANQECGALAGHCRR